MIKYIIALCVFIYVAAVLVQRDRAAEGRIAAQNALLSQLLALGEQSTATAWRHSHPSPDDDNLNELRQLLASRKKAGRSVAPPGSVASAAAAGSAP